MTECGGSRLSVALWEGAPTRCALVLPVMLSRVWRSVQSMVLALQRLRVREIRAIMRVCVSAEVVPLHALVRVLTHSNRRGTQR